METPGSQFQPLADGRVDGPADDRASYGSFATFADPDGNVFLLQEVTTRLPGSDRGHGHLLRVAHRPGSALKRAAAAHGEHAARNGGAYDQDWPEWYAAYMVAESYGDQLPP